jgi:glutathione S-transferase
MLVLYHAPHSIWQDKYPRVGEWYAHLQERPAFKATYFPGTRVSDFLELKPIYAVERG